MNRSRSWLKWPGAKYPILDRLKAVFPTRMRFVDVFAGGGSVLLNMRGPCWANDANTDLILAWTALQRHGVSFIEQCRALYTPAGDTAESYYALRREFNGCTDLHTRAVLFVYLNRHCFNGLCRYNRDGEFNAAYANNSPKVFPDAEMHECLPRLTECTFTAHDFRSVLVDVGRDDVVYCDPPYVPVSATSDFDRYHPGHFSLNDHRALAQHVKDAATRGAYVVVSNAVCDQARELYGQDATSVEPLLVRRHISGKASGRTAVPEMIFIYGDRPSDHLITFM